jgi:hypothetical protein
MNRLVLAFALVPMLSGCVGSEPPSPGGEATTSAVDFEVRLLEIARTYDSFGRLDLQAKWSPRWCRMASPAPLFSNSSDPATHGRKLYWLFVKEVPSSAAHGYIPPNGVNSIGQVVVKEAWAPEQVPDKTALETVTRKIKTSGGERIDCFQPYARKGGKVYHAKEKLGLFIMFKLGPKTPGTDNGWVYGTVTADGKKVTSAGRVESCMGCHKDAPHDRLFGLPGKKED